MPLDQLGLYTRPASPSTGQPGSDWGPALANHWDISEAGALAAMQHFFESGLQRYEAGKQRADARSVSKLSPYLHWGQLSVRLLWQRMRDTQ